VIVWRGGRGASKGYKLTTARLNKEKTLANVSGVSIPSGVVLTAEERELLRSFDAKCTLYELPGLASADAYAAMIAENRNWNTIYLSGSDLTDQGLRQFQEKARLARLDITKTRVSRAAAEAFRAQQPDCYLITDYFTALPRTARAEPPPELADDLEMAAANGALEEK
jgi:hypothetical protein